MSIPLQLQTFIIDDQSLEIFIPQAEAVEETYLHNKEAAYWAQVWPASIGLCRFLKEHPHYITDKTVLELAAGLGLPGLYIAPQAKQITITDRDALAVKCVKQSATYLQTQNVYTAVLDWKNAVQLPLPDTLLLSDVNYEPAVFDELLKVLEHFLYNKVSIIISTPQRLVAKQFINSLLPYCSLQWNCNVLLHAKETGVSVFVLEGWHAGNYS